MSSIAFYPTLILVGYICLVILVLNVGERITTKWLLENAPYLVIKNADTARSILSTMIGGLISIMVFSFSMVMMLLNQASNNFSPRLLPGLVSDSRNQIVLGIFLGTIFFNIIVLMKVLPDGNEYSLNGFAILSGILLGMSCLVVFIYFIHTVSSSIQIDNILKGIFLDAKQRINYLLDQDEESVNSDINVEGWYIVNSTKAGYYQGVGLKGLKKICKEKNLNLKSYPIKGEYILPNIPLYAVDKKLDENEIEVINSHFLFANNLSVSENFNLGFKQICEVGIKAMSPGINDPGTALITIDYLTELLALRMKLGQTKIYSNENNSFTIDLKRQSFEDILYYLMASYRQYCKHDIILMEKLVSMLNYLIEQPAKFERYRKVIDDQLQIVKQSIEANISSQADRSRFFEGLTSKKKC